MRKKQPTILRRILLPIMAVIMVQAILYTTIFLQGGVLSHTVENAYDILSERTINRQLYIENEMIHRWSKLEEGHDAINAKVKAVLEAENASIGDVKTSSSLNEKLVDEVSGEVLYLLRRNGVTGAFLVLDGAPVQWGDGNSHAGIYVRDLDPSNNSVDNSDLLLERGLPALSKKLNIPLDTYWQGSFLFKKDGSPREDFFYKPLEAALASDNKESSNFGYWSVPFQLSGADGQVMTYSIPLIYSDGTVYGVLGVDLSQTYVRSIMPYEELDANRQSMYVLAVTEDGTHFRRVFSTGPQYKAYFGEGSDLTGSPDSHESILQIESPNFPGTQLMGSAQYLKLYNVNTPFENQRWVLLGIADSRDLLSFPNQIKTIAYIASLASFLLGIAGVFITSRLVTRPISSLVEDLKKSDPNKPIHLDPIRIEEIDELTISIENLSSAVAQSASRFSRIIAMTNLPVGVFEYQEGMSTTFCSQSLLHIMGWDSGAQTDCYLDSREFKERMECLKPYLYNEQELIFRIPGDTDNTWLLVSILQDEDRYLGTVSDITRDMQEKLKIEYERDYDALTDLFNRRAFTRGLEELFQKPEQLKVAALIMWDLDNLKYVNDTYGHDFGDLYIRQFAKCLQSMRSEKSLVARRSGDEFYVFLYGYDSKEQIRVVIEESWKRIEQNSITLPNGLAMKIRVSGGVSWYPDDTQNWEELVRYADFAMYSIKHREKGSLQEFERDTYQTDFVLISGQEAFNKLVEQQLVEYAFQPIVQVSTGLTMGYELLMRPQVEGLNSVLEVLRLAKSQSKLYQIEKLTMFKAMETFVEAIQNGRVEPGQKAFINSIGNQMMIPPDIEEFRRRFEPYLSQMVLELTESEADANDYSLSKIRVIKSWGGLCALDDFGSGYNSEAQLILLQPDIVKVDLSIIRGIDTDIDRQNLLDSILAFAHKRGIVVLAEGVETSGEMETLIYHGVDLLQGYYLGCPKAHHFAVCPGLEEEIREIRNKKDGV